MDEEQLIIEFVDEAREHLADIEAQLLQIEALGADYDDNLVNTVFRSIHSVKGAAGFLGLQTINSLAHSLENVLGKIRDHLIVPTPYNVDVLLKGADRLRTLIEDVHASNGEDVTQLVQDIDAIYEAKPAEEATEAAAEAQGEAEEAEIAAASNEAETEQAAAEGGTTTTTTTKRKTTRRRKSTGRKEDHEP